MEIVTHFTHDNGGRPFKVNINHNKKRVEVYAGENYNIPKYTGPFQRVFVGEEGSAVLCERSNNKYVFIGERIFSFMSKSPITEFRAIIWKQ